MQDADVANDSEDDEVYEQNVVMVRKFSGFPFQLAWLPLCIPAKPVSSISTSAIPDSVPDKEHLVRHFSIAKLVQTVNCFSGDLLFFRLSHPSASGGAKQIQPSRPYLPVF